MRANTLIPMARTSASRWSIVSFGPSLLGIVVKPSIDIAYIHAHVPSHLSPPNELCANLLLELSRSAKADQSTSHPWSIEVLRCQRVGLARAKRALAVARQQQAKSCMARLWRDQGKRNEARELLAPIMAGLPRVSIR